MAWLETAPGSGELPAGMRLLVLNESVPEQWQRLASECMPACAETPLPHDRSTHHVSSMRNAPSLRPHPHSHLSLSPSPLLHLPCIPTIRKGIADDRPRVLPPSAAYEHFTDHESVRIVEKHVSRDFEYFGHLFPRLSTASGRPSGEELVDVSEWYAGVRAEAEAAETSHEG